jgi:hypothetical protein
MSGRVYRPRPVNVRIRAGGLPEAIGRAAVEAVREEWLVEDRWWTGRPLRRRYLELVTADGADRVVFCDLESGRWFVQRGA